MVVHVQHSALFVQFREVGFPVAADVTVNIRTRIIHKRTEMLAIGLHLLGKHGFNRGLSEQGGSRIGCQIDGGGGRSWHSEG